MDLGQALPNKRTRPKLVNGIQKRKQITHGYGFDPHVRQALYGCADLGFRQGFDDLTGVINPLGHAETPAARDDLIRGREVNIKSRLFIVATDLYGVAKAGGGDQPGGGAGVFQHGVGGDRCAVDNNRYPAEKILLGQSYLRASLPMPLSTPRAWFSPVVRTFSVCVCPASSAHTRSVKVPPTSTPKL